MAQISYALARLRRDPIVDLPLAAHIDQVLGNANVLGKVMGLLDAVTGMFVSLLDFGELSRAALPLFQHDMRSVISVHPMLRHGDILL